MTRLLIVFLLGCSNYPRPLTPREQEQAAVVIRAICSPSRWHPEEHWAGSGVRVDASLVVTARHVVSCEDSSLQEVTVAGHAARLILSDPEHDLALLELREPYAAVNIATATPTEGPVCVTPGFPAGVRHCGVIREVRTRQVQAVRVDLDLNLKTFAGNSGSGLFDVHGYFVGVVTHGYLKGGPYGGMGSSVFRFLKK